MAPPSGLAHSSLSPDRDGAAAPSISRSSSASAFPPLTRSATTPTFRADPSHLAPEDAFNATSPPRRPSLYDARQQGVAGVGNGHTSASDLRSARRPHHGGGSRSRSRRRKRTWKKLLWVKQSYPDNYTDQATFLENLQRNPRLQPYDFWPLVADSTVIVQHVCSVIIFIVCFVGIFQERVSPVAVVGWGSFATFIGWLLWDWWVGQESHDEVEGNETPLSAASPVERQMRPPRRQDHESRGSVAGEEPAAAAAAAARSSSSVSNLPSAASSASNLLGVTATPSDHSSRPTITGDSSASGGGGALSKRHSHSASASSLLSTASQTSATSPSTARRADSGEDVSGLRRRPTSPLRGGRASLRLGTIKSAVLIYFTLLGLSPILKSLTRSTSSDSIWAMSFWLLAINIFFFDYSGAWVGANKFPVASLSTNAALMASTVLASRLPSTGQVFSLTLFSIEVFGLFPVFRRYARHHSWRYHVMLTALLVFGAGGGVGMILGGDGESDVWPWRSGLVGILVGCVIAAVAMGGCSWWLIGLQKYKNEIYGPWDPARPIIISRRHWDDE